MCFRACMYLCFSQASAMLIWAGENNVPSIWKCENSAATSFAGRGQQQLYPTFTFLSERKGFCKYRHAQMQINALSLSLSLSHTHTQVQSMRESRQAASEDKDQYESIQTLLRSQVPECFTKT